MLFASKRSVTGGLRLPDSRPFRRSRASDRLCRGSLAPELAGKPYVEAENTSMYSSLPSPVVSTAASDTPSGAPGSHRREMSMARVVRVAVAKLVAAIP